MLEIQEKILTTLEGDEKGKRNIFLIQQIKNIPPPPANNNYFSQLLESFTHLQLPEEESEQHWINILENCDRLNQQTGRCPGIHVALLDYFINQTSKLENPTLVETNIFNETEKMAMVDGLTGLANRRFFDICFTKELKRAARYDKNLSLLFLDLDDFKKINDTNGHIFGDRVLKEFAEHLKDICREEDIPCRYGGEEFTIILPETSGPGALIFADRVREGLHKIDIFAENNITFSGGIAPYPYCGKTSDELIDNADKVLYLAKRYGKNRILISSFNERRKRQRFKENWQVNCVPISEKLRLHKKTIKTLTRDVSLGGIKIEQEVEYAVGNEILLEIEIPNGRSSIIGIIAWASNTHDDKLCYGVEFTDLKHHQIQKMMQVLPSDYFCPPPPECNRERALA